MKSKAQILLEKLFFSTLSVPKILLMSKRNGFKNIHHKKQHKDCIILANGPSLKKSIEFITKIQSNYDLMCVNHFAETEAYSILKPTHYILNAPEMWMDDVEPEFIKKGEKLFNAIQSNTKWEINLFIPSSAKNYSRWKNILNQNPQIHINYFNTTPVEGFDSLLTKSIYKGWGMPRPHNVLIPSTVLCMRMRYEKIYLVGADHSWLPEIWVDEANNVFLTQKHFYDEDKAKAKPMDKLGKGNRSLPEILEKFTYAFSAYFKLNEIAQKHNQKILNATEGSYIDAFERIKEIPAK